MIKKVTQFNVTYTMLSFTVCLYSTFIMPYLKAMGFTFTELGIFTSINITAAILGQFFIGYLCNFFMTIKKVFIVNLILLIVTSMMMQLRVNSVITVICIAAFGFFQAPLSVLLESWILCSEKSISENFGSIRAWASIGWAACAISMGGIIDILGWKFLFVFYITFALLTLFTTRNIGDVYSLRENTKKNKGTNFFILFKDYRYVFIVFIMILISIAQQPLSFLYIKINNLHGTSKHIGISAFVMSLSELPLFFCSKYIIKKFKLINLLLFCSVMYSFRMLLLGKCQSYNGIILLGVLQMFTFAIYIISYKYIIVEIVSKDMQIIAQTTASAICAVGGIVFGSSAGVLIDKYDINIIFYIGAVASAIAAISIVIYILLTKREKRIVFCEE